MLGFSAMKSKDVLKEEKLPCYICLESDAYQLRKQKRIRHRLLA